MKDLTVEQITDRGPNEKVSSEDSVELDRKRLARWCNDRWDEAEQQARQDAEFSEWDNWVDAYWGSAQPEVASYRQPVMTTEMRDLILQEAQEITDTKPKVHITGSGLPKELLKLAKDLLNAQWQNCNVRGALLDAQIWSNILPCGWIGVYWDGSKNDWLGDISVIADDPRQVLPASQARDDINWPYVVKYDWIDLYAIKLMWPDAASAVREETQPVTAGSKSPKTRSSPYLGPMFSSTSSDSKSTPNIPQSRVVSIWVRDPETEQKFIEIKDSLGNTTSVRPYHVRKYPRGRFIQVCGDVVLLDIPWRTSSFPLFRIIPQPAIGGFYPSPKVRDLLPIQSAVDKAWEQNIQNGERCNEGVWFTTGETGVDPSNFTPMPGMVVQGDAGSTLEMKAPQPFPESMLQQPERLSGIMRRKMGRTDARGGSVKGANVGQGLIETEISQAEIPTRMAAGLMYQSCKRIAQCMLETMALNYRSRRDVDWLDNGNVKSVPWEPIAEDQVRKLVSHLDEASFTPRSETLEKGMILKLAALGVVGPEYILKHIQIPDTEEALQELKTQIFQMWKAMQSKGKKTRR